MKSDPRDRNQWFDPSSASKYLKSYSEALAASIQSVDTTKLESAIQIIAKAGKSGAHIYAIGNGGSASIADHLCCDWSKGTHVDGQPSIKAHSLAANSAIFSAVANDFGYDSSFAKQLEIYGQKGDVLLAISSSGNSPNILNGVETAKAKGMSTIGLSGFEGGKLSQMVDVNLHVKSQNYGLVEDAHQALMHIIAQITYLRRL